MAESTPVGAVWVNVLPTTRGFGRDLERQTSRDSERAGRTAGGRFGKVWASASLSPMKAVGAAAVGLFAVDKVKDFFGSAIEEARESQKVSAITANVIKTTGGAAKISAKQVGDLATAISNKTGMDDEAIQSGANLLLTFKNVRNEAGKNNDVFNQATQAAADLSAAGFGDLNGASKQLGKALNDPIKGMTALGRSGVTFTEQQKKQIKSLVGQNDLLGAQKIILGEVQSQVGGAAEASATAGEKARVAWGNFKEQIGTALLPVIDKLAVFFTTKLLPAVITFGQSFARQVGPILKVVFDYLKMTALPAIEEFAVTFAARVTPTVRRFGEFIKTTVIPAVKDFGGFLKTEVVPRLRDFGEFIKNTVLPAAKEFAEGALKTTVSGLKDLAKFVKSNLDFFIPFAAVIGTAAVAFKVYSTAVKVISTVTRLWAAAQALLNSSLLANPITLVVIAIAALVGGVVLAYKRFETFRNIVDTAWRVIREAASIAWNNYYKPILGFLWSAIKFGWEQFQRFAGVVVNDVWPKVQSAVKTAWTVLKVTLDALWSAIKFGWERFQTFKRVVGDVWSAAKSLVSRGVAGILTLIADMAEKVVLGADLAFGWIPGIGSKLDKAKGAIRSFKDSVNATLAKIEDQDVTISVAAKGILAKNALRFANEHVNRKATGGAIHGPGTGTSDSIPALLSNGEHVWTAKEVANAGGHSAIEAMRAQFRYAKGGPVEFETRAVTPRMADFRDLATRFNRGISTITAGIRSAVQRAADEVGTLSGGHFTPGRGGWPAPRLGVISPNTAAAAAYIRKRWGVYSGILGSRPNVSDHPYGKALDAMTSNVAKGNDIASYFTGHPGAFGTKYVIWRQQINSGSGWRHMEDRGSPTANHMDHVHVSLFDKGGMLKPGQLAYNGSNKPEPVFTGREFESIKRLAEGGGYNGPLVNIEHMQAVDVEAGVRKAELRARDAVTMYQLASV